MDLLTCTICDRTFSKVENLVVHLTSRKHRSSITDVNRHIAARLYTQYHADLVKRSAYQCACCTFAAVHHDGLITHLKSQQHNENVVKLSGPLECVPCSFLDYDGSSMLAHCLSEDHQKVSSRSIVLKERRSQIKCLKCSKVLHSTLHYTRHMANQHLKTVSADVKLKKCDYCEFIGKPSTVNQHISRTHRSERPYLCKVCQTDFHSKYDLAKHYNTGKHIDRVFSSYKEFVVIAVDGGNTVTAATSSQRNMMRCNYCIYSTSELSLLQCHYKSTHNNMEVDDTIQERKPSSRPVFCRYCNQQSTNNASLFAHELKHVQVCFRVLPCLFLHSAPRNCRIFNSLRAPAIC